MAAMQWGGIRPRNFKLIGSLSGDELNNRLNKINKWINRGRPAEDILNEYMKNDSSVKISGVGVSFITKYLYFKNRDRFLIYDRWIQNVHYAMLLSDGQNPDIYFKSYKGDLTKGKNRLELKSDVSGAAYEDFLTRLRRLYQHVNDGLVNRGYAPFRQLDEYEAFLFGKREVGYYSGDNPRKLVAIYIHDFLGDNPKKKYWPYYEHLFDANYLFH